MSALIRVRAYAARPLAQMENRYRLRGSVLDAAGNPQRRKVLLLKESGLAPGNLAPTSYSHVWIIRSGPDGQWEKGYLFDGLYTAIAYDHTGEYDPVIKGGLTPEPME